MIPGMVAKLVVRVAKELSFLFSLVVFIVMIAKNGTMWEEFAGTLAVQMECSLLNEKTKRKQIFQRSSTYVQRRCAFYWEIGLTFDIREKAAIKIAATCYLHSHFV